MKLALLLSGNLGLSMARYLYDRDYNIEAILTDKNSSQILDFATSKNIKLFVGNPRKGRCEKLIEDVKPEVLISVNYLFLIENDLIQWPSKIAFNVHGSLLPKYRGRTPHVWSIINNEKVTGITAHILDEDCDAGDILQQKQVKIEKNDTGGDILKKFGLQYPKLIDKVLSNINSNKLQRIQQDESLATYFEKRVPEDGKIDWNWQKERIRNWVRAQSYPYPGAFTNFGDQIIIIDEVSFDNYGFRQSMKNGEVISANPIRIKTPNGVLLIKKIRGQDFQFSKGMLLK
ncbi:methionyl-tRNA formyltransferase [Ekhidna sp.]